MRLLLDTHIWVWSVLAPERLTRRVRNALTGPNAESWLSAISVWEVLLLIEKGRLKDVEDPEAWVGEALAAGGFHEAPLTHAIARESGRVVLPHHDPADRLLVATARVLDLTLVTADERLFETKSCRMLPNP
jgi:PIN domain nuclease of toxin-antitoxin system